MSISRILPSLSAPSFALILLIGQATVATAQAGSMHPRANRIQLPLAFEANTGQTNRRDDFLAHGPGYRLSLSPREATFQMATAAHSAETLTMHLSGANPAACAVQNTAPTGHANYFLGKDPGKWRTNVPLYARIEYRQVYRGIDLVYYGNQNQLEYDFLVRPGTDPKRIALKFTGAQKVRIAANGELILGMKQGEVRWHRPLTYQMVAGKKRMVASSFVRKSDGGIGFKLARYDTSRALVIDPQLIYSTFLGGSVRNSADALAVDSAGNTYIAGTTNSLDFPTTPGALQPRKKAAPYLGNDSVFVAKLNATGTALIYATYLSGAGTDRGQALAIDSQGCAYVAGLANSQDFPVTPGAFQTVNPASTILVIVGFSATGFVAKLNPTGSALVYSTFLGGHSGDYTYDTVNGIALDGQGNAYLTGIANSPDFPTTPGAFQATSPATSADKRNPGSAFVTKLNASGTGLIYSTYLGGTIGASGNAIAVDSQGSAYVTGRTTSLDFPTSDTAFQKKNLVPPFNGGTAFVTKVKPDGTGLVYSTFLGGEGKYGDVGNGIVVDSGGSAYVTGNTSSFNFPTTPGALQPARLPSYKTVYNVFVTRLNATGSALLYSTDIGEGMSSAIALDSTGSVCITGYTAAIDYPTTAGAFKRINAPGNFTAFVTRINSAGSAILYSTYMSRSFSYGAGIALDRRGIATICGGVYGPDYPITANAFQTGKRNPTSEGTGVVTRLSTISIFPDFNNDGNVDILLRNRTTGLLGTWFLHGAEVQGGTPFSQTPPATYVPVGTGDFLSNGSTTLVFQDSVDNRVIFWYTSGANNAIITGGDYVSPTPAPGWKLMGVGDFNQDGRSDLLFQNQTTGQVVVWYMNGPYYQDGVSLALYPGAGWQVAGVGDFNGDGFTDIAFQNQTTGKLKIWFMQGKIIASESALLATVPPGWSVASVGDYNGDGKADLLIQNPTTGQCAVLYLNGTAYLGGGGLSQNPPADWKIVGPR